MKNFIMLAPCISTIHNRCVSESVIAQVTVQDMVYVRTLAACATTIIWGRGVKSSDALTTALVMDIVLMASVVAIADIKVINP